MNQITISFEASEFDAFANAQEQFRHMTYTIKDEKGETVKNCVQAMRMDYSPSQWSQKINSTNNTCVTIKDAEKHTEIFGETSWIKYLVWKHIIKPQRNRDIEEMRRELAEAEKQLLNA
ncbi:MAG: hypothetical protein AAF098_16910 [Pseudomonadota bacterium]